ncbi:MAG: DNA-processing protein DprA [Clostridia bacterium]|nr:DNA-processing protein DprA [Clostridia bacterium]
MKDKIAWAILAHKNRSCKKIKELARDFEKKKKTVDFTSDEAIGLMNDIDKATKRGVKFITYMDKQYPEELRHIAYPPPYLYVRGRIGLLKHPLKVTIVGSRKATGYGINVAATLGHEIAANKICVVSGGAEGVDTAALRGALRTSDDVIAVIGTGIDVNYPPENKKLFDTIAARGVVVSEFPMGMGPLGHNFPVRNRIMTALGDSVVIVEAASRSGALISAKHAEEQGKTLFAVPGNIDSPNSVGANELLRDGARFCMSSGDVIEELMERLPDKYREAQGYIYEEEESEITETAMPQETEKPEIFTANEKAVVNAIKMGKDTYEEILEFCALETNKLTSLLTFMEIKGIIKLAFGNHYKLTK